MTALHLNDPPSEERARLQALADLLAKILDRAIPIPGTSMTIGLDPLLGLIPGIGDGIAGLMGSMILILATRLGAPKILLARMSLNLLVNGVIGAIPGLGDLFSVWFRSNARNAKLLQRVTSAKAPAATSADWAFVIGILAATVVILIGGILAVLWLVKTLWVLVQ
ncbi:MAG: DUF4112 domain-containing protein [Nitrospiraceae bacterium]